MITLNCSLCDLLMLILTTISTFFIVKGANIINKNDHKNNLNKILKSDDIYRAILYMIKNSKQEKYLISEFNFYYGGLYIGKSENYNPEKYNELNKKIEKSRLSSSTKKLLKNYAEEYYMNKTGTNRIYMCT